MGEGGGVLEMWEKGGGGGNSVIRESGRERERGRAKCCGRSLEIRCFSQTKINRVKSPTFFWCEKMSGVLVKDSGGGGKGEQS